MTLLRHIHNAIHALLRRFKSMWFRMKRRHVLETDFLHFAQKMGNAEGYLKANPDVAAARLDGLQHWFEHGLGEGRTFPGIDVRRGRQAKVTNGSAWRQFMWQGEPVAARVALPYPESILRQILSQGRHDTAVFAPGADAIPNLRRFDATDLLVRHGIDPHAVLAAAPEGPSAVFVVPHLVTGGAEKYISDLVDCFVSARLGPVVVLVTDQTEDEAKGWRDLAILAPIGQAQIMFWREFCNNHGYQRPETLARFLNVLRPQHLFICNSFIGLEAVARFGRGLSQFACIACFYFSISPKAIGAPYGAYFPRRTLPFATAITDNEPMARTLRSLHGEIPGPGIITLPPRLPALEDAVFTARLAARRARSKAAAKPLRWAWVSRIEPFKGTALLAALARARPTDHFDVFGPLSADMQSVGLDLPNITMRGQLANVVKADFADHDGFLFTSLFEGMPNVVLEMSQQAIPMVLADVGGLRDTFDENAVILVSHGTSTQESVAGFSAALDRVSGMSAEEVDAMAAAARLQALSRHSADIYKKNVAALIGRK